MNTQRIKTLNFYKGYKIKSYEIKLSNIKKRIDYSKQI